MIKELIFKVCMNSVTIDQETGCKTLHVIIMHENGIPKMLRLNIGKQGTCIMSSLNAIASLVSLHFQVGTPIENIIESLNNYHCHRPKHTKDESTWSCVDALSKALKEFKNKFLV